MPVFMVVRTDGSFQRQLMIPSGTDPQHLLSSLLIFFTPSGDQLIVRDIGGNLTAYSSTTDNNDVSLGTADQNLVFDSTDQALLSCGPGGLRRIPLDGSSSTLLDSVVCDPDVLRILSGEVLYKRGNDVYEVPELGRMPTAVLQAPPGQVIGQVLAVGPSNTLLYSLDPPSEYGNGIGDGWIGGIQYINRGRRPVWSLDGQKLRWLENAARSDGTGDLTAALIAAPAPQLLALNVRQFSEVASGQLLCASNQDGKGTYNRIILIDEEKQVAHWVVDSARSFTQIPGTSDVLVEIVSGAAGYDIRRVPIPLDPETP
jgi:hypothetical protein